MALAATELRWRGSVKSAARTVKATRGRARQFQVVFDNSLVPMLIIDNERRFVAANRAARLLLRLSLTELRSRRVSDLTPPHTAQLMESAWTRMFHDGSACGSFDLEFQDGSLLRVSYCGVANVLPGQHLMVLAPADWPEDELGIVEDSPAAPAGEPLSPREREVLTLVAAGARSEQIADELMISPSTVKTHVKNALQKLGARNRAHAIALSMQLRLIDLPGEPDMGGRRATA